MNKKILIAMIVIMSITIVNADKIDLNTASLQELLTLPISEEQAYDIYDYRYYHSFFNNIYELRNIDSIDQRTLNRLRPLLYVSFYDDRDEAAIRREEISYLLERLGTDEGMQEGISDVWEDYLLTPRNLNRLYYSDILSMPNVSTIDAAAISRRIARGDEVNDYRDLRNTPGVGYYGASNLRHYVAYDDDFFQRRLYFDYQLKYHDAPYMDEPNEMYREMVMRRDGPASRDLTYWGYFNMSNLTPASYHKLRMRYANEWKVGLAYNAQKGETGMSDLTMREFIQDGKYYAGYENNVDFYGSNYFKIYAGNYRATFGEGLVMENTDFYSARKTGHGFSKRITGIIGDLSRTEQYNLRGLAAEWKRKELNLAIFYSQDKKDALVYLDEDGNPTDEVFSYVTMTQRFSDDEFSQAEEHFYQNSNLLQRFRLAPRTNSVEEKLIGGHIEYSPFIGTHIGFTGYEAVYDKDFVVYHPDSLATLLLRDPANDLGKFKLMDSEIAALYSTKTDFYERDYRRVLGFDWRTVINNTSFQGEYAELTVDGKDLKFGDDPSAFVMSSYTQFENLYLLMIYRNYDLDFDNPYSRGFSEHPKFRNTLLDNNPHTLENPLIADLYINSAQAQAEEGFYIETRYRFHQRLTITRAYLDLWERKADARKSVRFQGELEYRPIHQLQLRLKYKNQTNRYDDDADRGVSKTDETTLMARIGLSNRNRLQFEYRYNRVWFPPYTYLANHPDPGGHDIAQANSLIHGDFISAEYIHNFNQNFKIHGAILYWDGHGISHWDWEDMEIDFMGQQGMKYWFTISSMVSQNLFIRLKYHIKNYKTRELDFRKWWNDPVDEYYSSTTVERRETSMRLQLDWKF